MFKVLLKLYVLRMFIVCAAVIILFTPGKNAASVPIIINRAGYSTYCAMSHAFSFFPACAAIPLKLASYRRKGMFIASARANLFSVLWSIYKGREYKLSIHFRCGMRSRDVIKQMNMAPGLVGELEELPEGSILADTYKYVYGTKRKVLVRLMQHELAKALEKNHTSKSFLSPSQACILASILPNEGEFEDFEKMTNVFFNRMKKGMRLQACSTVLYGLDNTQKLVTKQDLKEVHEYNTYRKKGLPEKPIGNPCTLSLKSAGKEYDARDKNLFFVSNGQGGHVFSSVLKDHIRNTYKYRLSQTYQDIVRGFLQVR